MRERILQAAIMGLVTAACQAEGSSAAGQGTASGSKPFVVSEVAKYDAPWAMAFLPGSGARPTNLALITEKDGRLFLHDLASGQRQQVSGVPQVLNAGQGGLGDVVPHPDFAANRRIYLTFVEAGEDGTSGAALGYGTLVVVGPAAAGAGTAPTLQDFKVIWRQNPKVSGNGHFSHRIAFARDGSLFLSSGERQKFDPAQEMSGNLGKILHLTAEGRPAPGNPFANRGGIAAQVYTLGMRNNLGLAFAPDGRLWATEMGPKGGDELNLIEAGKNYGYPIVSDGDHYDGRDIPDHKTNRTYAAPRLSWNPSISPAGMIIYSGNLFPQWRGDAILARSRGRRLSAPTSMARARARPNNGTWASASARSSRARGANFTSSRMGAAAAGC